MINIWLMLICLSQSISYASFSVSDDEESDRCISLSQSSRLKTHTQNWREAFFITIT